MAYTEIFTQLFVLVSFAFIDGSRDGTSIKKLFGGIPYAIELALTMPLELLNTGVYFTKRA